MKLFNIFLASTILASGLSATELKRSIKVIPLDPKYLSTEYGGTNHASAVLSDGIGVYSTSFDEYARAISYLNGKYGDDALKDEKSLKEYVIKNGTVADKELANKLNLVAVQKSNVGDSCDDGDSTTMDDMYTDDAFTCVGKVIIGSECDDGNAGTTGDAYVDNAFTCEPKNSVIGATCDDLNPQTENDVYIDTNFTCKGSKISNSLKCYGEPIGSSIIVNGVSYLVVDNTTIIPNRYRIETMCTSNVTNMKDLFKGMYMMGRDISHWDVSNVTDMSFMFYNTPDFNGSIGDWDVSKVTSMHNMFSLSKAINQDISKWDVSNVTLMNNMFASAAVFNKNLSKWCVSKILSKPINFDNSATKWTNASYKPVWGTCPAR